MAIQTRGFQVDVLPRFTPVDPNLAAFNPGSFLTGYEQAVDARRKQAALEAAQAEQEFLAKYRPVQLESAQLGLSGQRADVGLKEIDLAYQRGIADQKAKTSRAQLGLAERTAIGEDKLLDEMFANKAAQQTLDAERLSLQKDLLPVTNTTARTLAETASTKAITDQRKAVAEGVSVDDTIKAAQKELELATKKLDYELKNWQSGKIDAQQLVKSQIDAHNAEAALKNAQAKALQDDTSPSSRKIAAMNAARSAAVQLAKTVVPDVAMAKSDGTAPDITLAEWAEKYIDPKTGELKKEVPLKRPIIWNTTQANPETTLSATYQLYRQYKAALNEMDNLRGHQAPSAANAPVVKTKAEYDALAAGSEFVGSDGKRYVKPTK